MAAFGSTFLGLWRNAPSFRWLVTIATAASLLALFFPPRLMTLPALGPGQYSPPAAGLAPPPIPIGPGGAALPAPVPVSVPPAGPLAPARPSLQMDAPTAASGRPAPASPSVLPERRGLPAARPGFDQP